MTYNAPSGESVADLIARAVAALVREWGVTEDEARAAIDRVRVRELRLGPEMAREWEVYPFREPRQSFVIDLTALEARCDAGSS